MYGSCWGMQLITVALGGVVASTRRGAVGIARNITLNDGGRLKSCSRASPAHSTRYARMRDEVETLPQGATVLACNGMSAIQAMEIARDGGSFLGVQYHPEHTFATTAAILEARTGRLVEDGFARSAEDMQSVIADLRALEADPGRRDIAWRLGLDKHVLDPALRSAEFGNWLRAKVLPRHAERLAAA